MTDWVVDAALLVVPDKVSVSEIAWVDDDALVAVSVKVSVSEIA